MRNIFQIVARNSESRLECGTNFGKNTSKNGKKSSKYDMNE